MAGRAARDDFRRTLRDDLASGIAAFRPKINYPVGSLDHVQGLIRIIPQFSKSATLRVAKVAR